MRYGKDKLYFIKGRNPAIQYVSFKKNNADKKRNYSFVLSNGDIYVAFGKSIRLAYVQIREEVNPDDIALIFPYKPPLPVMLCNKKFVYWKFHPYLFKRPKPKPLPILKDATRVLIERLFNTSLPESA